MLNTARWVQGRFGSALEFTDGTGWVEVANSGTLEPVSGVTVSAWVKATGSPGPFRYVVAKGATGCIAASYAIYSGSNGGLAFYVSKSRGRSYTLSPDAGTDVWDGHWHMVVGTFDGSSVRLFVDGTQIGTGSPHAGQIEYLLPDSNDLYIGDYPGCQEHSFLGTIDEVQVFARAQAWIHRIAAWVDADRFDSVGW